MGEEYLVLGHKSGTILWLVYYYKFCELLSAFVWGYRGIFWFDLNMQPSAVTVSSDVKYSISPLNCSNVLPIIYVTFTVYTLKCEIVEKSMQNI